MNDNPVTMKKSFFEHSQGFACGAIFMSLMLVVFDVTPNAVEKKWQVEAVKHFAAEWVVDSDGNSTFQWKNGYALKAIPENVENSSSLLLLPDEMMPNAGKEN